MQESKWLFAFASVTGNSHISENIPCQDACDVQVYDGFSISVVSDGAGSCNNSDKGSKFVVNTSHYRFYNLVHTQGWVKNKCLPSQEIWHNWAKRTLNDIRDDLVKYSLCNDLDFKSLSCTVIITITLQAGLLTTHIGDGRAGYCNDELKWEPIIVPFHGELANQTVFLTSNIWDDEFIDEFIKSNVIADDVKAFCLLTDGCEKASFECNLFDKEKEIYFDPNKPFEGFFNPNLKILEKLHYDGKSQEEINELWRFFLEAGNSKLKSEPDDKTLILGVRL